MVKTLQDTPTSAQTSTIDPRVFLLALGMFALGTDAYEDHRIAFQPRRHNSLPVRGTLTGSPSFPLKASQ